MDSILSDGCIVTRRGDHEFGGWLEKQNFERRAIDSSFLMGADYYQTLEEMRDDLLANKPRVGIGEGTVINRAIIDKNARIGSNVRCSMKRESLMPMARTAPITFATELSLFRRTP